jgi:hypothetical protein
MSTGPVAVPLAPPAVDDAELPDEGELEAVELPDEGEEPVLSVELVPLTRPVQSIASTAQSSPAKTLVFAIARLQPSGCTYRRPLARETVKGRGSLATRTTFNRLIRATTDMWNAAQGAISFSTRHG